MQSSKDNLYMRTEYKPRQKKKYAFSLILGGMLFCTLINNCETVYAKQFNDVQQKDWYYETIDELSNKKVIDGYLDGSFKPNGTITKKEFLKLLISELDGPKTAVNGDWFSGYQIEVINAGIAVKNTNFDSLITRNEMSEYISKATKVYNKTNQATSNKLPADFSSVDNKYKEYVKDVFSKNIIRGDEKGNFNGNNNMTRAEAAQVIKNLENIKQNITEKENLGNGAVINLNNPRRTGIYSEGDTVITKDGRKVVLRKGKSGVLGEGQGLDLYTGITFDNGYTFVEGDLGEDDWGVLGQPYTINPKTGEGHFRDEWLMIMKETKPEYKGKVNGEVSKDGNWVWDSEGIPCWLWNVK